MLAPVGESAPGEHNAVDDEVRQEERQVLDRHPDLGSTEDTQVEGPDAEIHLVNVVCEEEQHVCAADHQDCQQQGLPEAAPGDPDSVFLTSALEFSGTDAQYQQADQAAPHCPQADAAGGVLG